ncbi:MAG: hypothetical protein CENE_00306 [Candidatus Celerinatantimonas neptuna]|nr:MAG: hypothetical protein CENE_00306 [Candidatus Celerinatantimonas neptuna]
MYWIQWVAPVVAIVVIVFGAILLWLGRKQYARQQQKIASFELLTKRMVKSHDSMYKQFTEVHAANHSMAKRVAELENIVEQTANRQNEIVTQDPDSKLYTRAVKMVELGADIEEVMSECELPRAEAELLYTLHGKPLSRRP